MSNKKVLSFSNRWNLPLLLKRNYLTTESQHKEVQHLATTEKNVLDTLHYIDLNYYRRLTLDD